MAARIANQITRLMIGGGVTLAVGAGVYNNVLYNVEPGHRAIIFDQLRGGVQETVKSEGTHFVIPFVQYPIFYDVRAQPQPISVVTPSKDLQTISLTLRILYRPVEQSLPRLYRDYNVDYAERVLPSIGNEVLKAVVAQYDASELITQRETVSLQVREALNKRAGRFGIVLEDISITHLTFGREFTSAVELKQVAAQEAERARFVVEKAEQEKLANVIRAEGDAKAAELISQALEQHGKGLIELRKIEASMDIAKTLSHSPRVAYLPAGKGLLMNLSV